MKKKPAQGKGKSLVEFVLQKKRAGCRVCQLLPDVQEEIRAARTRKITRAVVLEWLQKERGIRVTGAEMDNHTSGRHSNG